MKRAADLEARLVEWGKEYGGSRYENTGWQGISPLAQLMKYHGRPPQGLNPARLPIDGAADKVEQAVRALESQEDGWKAAQALRCEYMTPGLANEARRQRLSRVGVQCSRAQYYQLLRMGLIHVAAWLRIGFSCIVDGCGEN